MEKATAMWRTLSIFDLEDAVADAEKAKARWDGLSVPRRQRENIAHAWGPDTPIQGPHAAADLAAYADGFRAESSQKPRGPRRCGAVEQLTARRSKRGGYYNRQHTSSLLLVTETPQRCLQRDEYAALPRVAASSGARRISRQNSARSTIETSGWHRITYELAAAYASWARPLPGIAAIETIQGRLPGRSRCANHNKPPRRLCAASRLPGDAGDPTRAQID